MRDATNLATSSLPTRAWTGPAAAETSLRALETLRIARRESASSAWGTTPAATERAVINVWPAPARSVTQRTDWMFGREARLFRRGKVCALQRRVALPGLAPLRASIRDTARPASITPTAPIPPGPSASNSVKPGANVGTARPTKSAPTRDSERGQCMPSGQCAPATTGTTTAAAADAECVRTRRERGRVPRLQVRRRLRRSEDAVLPDRDAHLYSRAPIRASRTRTRAARA